MVNVLRYTDSQTTMVFCATREMVRHMQAALVERGFSSVALSGELGQNERTRAIDSLRKGQANVCVATDVAARGIDIPALALVVHATLPTDPATLLHRSGRTGRAGRKGVCVLMVPMSQRRRAERLMQGAKITASWSGVPTAAEIRAQDARRLLADPALTQDVSEADAELVGQLVEGRTSEQLAAALLQMYRARLPAPENVRHITPDAPRPMREGREGTPRPPRESYASSEPGAWFAMSVGRQDKADPKWLIPLICRLGGVRKADIGAIRINDTQTLFEITPDSTEKFRSCIASIENDEVQITPASAPAGGPARRSGPPRGGPGRSRASPAAVAAVPAGSVGRRAAARPRASGPAPESVGRNPTRN